VPSPSPKARVNLQSKFGRGEKSIKKHSVPSPSPRGRVNLQSKFGRGKKSKNNFKI